MLSECWRYCVIVTSPWATKFQFWIVAPAKWKTPSSTYVVSGVISPRSTAIAVVSVLNTEPGS